MSKYPFFVSVDGLRRLITCREEYDALILAEQDRLADKFRAIGQRPPLDVAESAAWNIMRLRGDNDPITPTFGVNDAAYCGPYLGVWVDSVGDVLSRLAFTLGEEEQIDIDRLIQSLQEAETHIADIANQLDKWAEESTSGGWSTHQVDPMRRLASTLRAYNSRRQALLATAKVRARRSAALTMREDAK